MIAECLRIWIQDRERRCLEQLRKGSINEDALLSFKSMMEEKEYYNIIQDNVVMELNDDDPSSKLLGIQIDIDLEDKGKSSEDMA